MGCLGNHERLFEKSGNYCNGTSFPQILLRLRRPDRQAIEATR